MCLLKCTLKPVFKAFVLHTTVDAVAVVVTVVAVAAAAASTVAVAVGAATVVVTVVAVATATFAVAGGGGAATVGVTVAVAGFTVVAVAAYFTLAAATVFTIAAGLTVVAAAVAVLTIAAAADVTVPTVVTIAVVSNLLFHCCRCRCRCYCCCRCVRRQRRRLSFGLPLSDLGAEETAHDSVILPSLVDVLQGLRHWGTVRLGQEGNEEAGGNPRTPEHQVCHPFGVVSLWKEKRRREEGFKICMYVCVKRERENDRQTDR